MPSHYLNQCWNIINWIPRNKLQLNLNRNLYIFIQENAFENVIWKMAAILVQPQCVKGGKITNKEYKGQVFLAYQFHIKAQLAHLKKTRCNKVIRKTLSSQIIGLQEQFFNPYNTHIISLVLGICLFVTTKKWTEVLCSHWEQKTWCMLHLQQIHNL